MRALSHVLVVLLCSASVACCIACLIAVSFPRSLVGTFISLTLSTGHLVQCDGCIGKGWVRRMGLMVGL